LEGIGQMSPHQSFARIPLEVGSELRIRNNGEVHVTNASAKAEPEPEPDSPHAVLEYRFDPQTGEHVLRLLEPVALRAQNRRTR